MQISDMQHLAYLNPQLYTDTASWIVNNSASYNLKMVVYTGDFVDAFVTHPPPPPPLTLYNASELAEEWAVANAAMSKLLDAGIPYCWDAGNHDQTPYGNNSGTMIGSSYPAFKGTTLRLKPYWVSDIFDMKNTAVKFTTGNFSFLVVNIEYMANSSAITWMKNLLDSNPSANVIVATHSYLSGNADYSSSSSATAAWNSAFKATLDTYPNVFLTLSGHVHSSNMTRAGNREEVLSGLSGAVTNGTGAASVRIYTFNLTGKQVYASTYSVDAKTLLTDSYNQFSFNASITSDWSLVTDARALKTYPDLREYVWQKDARMPPNGQHDKIGLHRLVKTGITPKGVVFMLPGVYGSGEGLVSNPATDNFTKTENMSQCIYWANRGFDVYTIDRRTHFIPINSNKSQLSTMADWGIDQFIGDIKEAVDKAKEVSGAQKVFMAGQSLGGMMAQIYAAKYWQQDLRGLILLDPAMGTSTSTITKNQNLTNSYNLTAVVNAMKTAGTWAWENPQASATSSPLNPGYVFLVQFAAQNPNAPAQYLNGTLVTTINPRTNKTWSNITEWLEYSWNIANSVNTYGGYSDITVDVNVEAQKERYYPVRYYLDILAMQDWSVDPYVPYDYLAHVKEINVPVFAFRSGLNLAAYGNIVNGIATTDFTWTVLPNYGHRDVFQGTYSARDVSEPAYQWMLSHLSTLDVTAFQSVTVLPGWTWYFFAQNLGGNAPYAYQWYEGLNPIQGQTSMVMPISKTVPGVYSFYCRVTDKDGTTTTSNAVTLTVIG
jgi:pimeloyl-ACP methyl ester carboxylesterase